MCPGRRASASSCRTSGKGKLVGWQSRRLDSSDGTPKWLSTPEFPKDSTLFNYDEVCKADPNFVVVCESPMSTLRHQHHLPIVATFGAEVTDRQVRLMAEFDRVVLWMDPDNAGWRAPVVGTTTRASSMTASSSAWSPTPMSGRSIRIGRWIWATWMTTRSQRLC